VKKHWRASSTGYANEAPQLEKLLRHLSHAANLTGFRPPVDADAGGHQIVVKN
jgi:hypothetical protein